MGFFDAVLGRVFAGDTELELGAGVSYRDGLTAERNDATSRVDVSVDTAYAPTLRRAGADYVGNTTAVAAGTEAVYAALNGAATSIAMADVVADGAAVDVVARVWIAKSDGTIAYRDVLRFAVYRETASGEIHILDVNQEGNDTVGTGASEQNLALVGANSGITYVAVVSSYSGTLAIAVGQTAGTARNAQISIELSPAWTPPVA